MNNDLLRAAMGADIQKNFTPEQLSVISEMKQAGVYNCEVTPEVSVDDLRQMLKYALLGQDYTPAIKHYKIVKSCIAAYLGAIYVGVDENDGRLLAFVAKTSTDGLHAEDRIDRLKQEAAYRYLYNNKGNNIPSNLLYFIWSGFDKDADTIDEIDKHELQFWWELIPSKDYIHVGSVCDDILEYISKRGE